MKYTILAVDDESDMLKTFESILRKKYHLLSAQSAEEALQKIEKENIDLVLLDIRMPKMDGIELLKIIKKNAQTLDVIMVSASKDLSSAIEAMKIGALDYIPKPFEVKELLAIIEKALEKRALVRENLYLKEVLAQASSYCDLLGNSPLMKKVFETIDTVAKTDSRILVTGESGTGKELVARAIHNKSPRAEKPFIVINCAAIPDNLLESELFGYERGAFTGALERKLGKFELADEGTIFLDEIGCMSMSMQAKLLRVIQDAVIDRIGGTTSVAVDIRLVAATNIDFKKAIAEGRFREDLFYRLNVIPIHLPSLRERKEDIPLFLDYFINKFNKELNRCIHGFDQEAVIVLKNYDWPGNVRELQNIVERMATLSSKLFFTKEDVEKALNLSGTKVELPVTLNFNQAVANFEREYLKNILQEAGGNRSKAARMLGIARTTLISKLDVLGLD